MHQTAAYSEPRVPEKRRVFNVDSCVCCCNLYLTVIPAVNVWFFKKKEIKDGEEPRMSDFCFIPNIHLYFRNDY